MDGRGTRPCHSLPFFIKTFSDGHTPPDRVIETLF